MPDLQIFSLLLPRANAQANARGHYDAFSMLSSLLLLHTPYVAIIVVICNMLEDDHEHTLK